MAPHAEDLVLATEHFVTTKKEVSFLENLENYLSLGCIHLIETANLQALYRDPSKKTIRELAQSLQLLEDCHFSVNILTIRSAFAKLLEHGWIRISCPPGVEITATKVIRIHVLPHDVGRRFIRRESKELQSSLQSLVHAIDISSKAWLGHKNLSSDAGDYLDPWAAGENCSLFYLFNTLPSPSPNPQVISDRHSRHAVKRLLNPSRSINGLKTHLYPYQARSAAMMVQRESTVQLELDPRLEIRDAPDGQKYYFDARQCFFLRNPRYFDSNRGGILAETMGLGKTVICLAVILATKYHLPRIPQQYKAPPKVRESVGNLGAMAAASLQRASIPARSFFAEMATENGQEMAECLRTLDSETAEYMIPGQPIRLRRQAGNAPSKRIQLCRGTIIVVPGNLIHQWKAEIKKHVNHDGTGLNVLVIEQRNSVPSASELAKYDIVLFSRYRFEQEARDGSDEKGRRRVLGVTPRVCACPYIGATRTRKCTCLKDEDLYQSPIKDLHWLRIIIDEGHEFSSSNSTAVVVANSLVRTERRWVVSGTPARDRLFGVEVDLAVNDDLSMIQSMSPDDNESVISSRDFALEQRRHFDAKEESTGAAKSLGLLASHFLQVKPWSESPGDPTLKVDWEEYIFRHEDLRRRTFSAFSSCLRRTMESLIVKTQPDDVERDIILPPLEHRVIYLEPSFHDKTIFNLFILFLTANAVTSEREDRDYLFHKDSAKARGHLLANLRQSTFFWTGFTEEDVKAAIGHGESYLSKPLEEVKCTAEDRALLSQCLDFAHMLQTVTSWKALSKTHEIGLFVKDWPEESCNDWNLNHPKGQLMSGVTQLLQAQTFVNANLTASNPTGGLANLGKAAITQAYELAEEKTNKGSSQQTQLEGAMAGVPISGLHTDVLSVKQHYAVSTGKPGMVKKSPKKAKPVENGAQDKAKNERNSEKMNDVLTTLSKLTPKKRRQNAAVPTELPNDSPLRRTNIIGTTSAKLSYLLDKIVALHSQEKILVFYDGENTAYYVAQCLELLHIKHLIYAKSLKLESKSKYIVTFDQDDSVRVLLMDIRCGALGLNVNKASRVFFVNPCNRPSIEAQAIKRAHRIGQDKPVFVETLILKGTLEERIFARSKSMTRTEHVETRVLEDDKEIANVIKSAKPLTLVASDAEGDTQMAKLQLPQQLFGRAGRENAHIKGIDKEKDEADDIDEPNPKKRRTTKKKPERAAPYQTAIALNGALQRIPSPHVEITVPIRSPPATRSLFGNGISLATQNEETSIRDRSTPHANGSASAS